ncbi:hypothetical protein PVAP13_1NG050608 [Panicum virgatum]|uniref:Uncharacterized protein n=1 Tax=Panicum virgatum TaxID=38727 RepID=A0A8T0WY25_PANVG|nr:hypothetical protein PVAP13_1NG050608 [Panicum virgatum]
MIQQRGRISPARRADASRSLPAVIIGAVIIADASRVSLSAVHSITWFFAVAVSEPETFRPRWRRRPRLKQARAVGAAGGAAGRGPSAARAGASRTGAKAGPAPAAGGGKLMGREASTARPGALCDRRQPPRLRQGSAPVSPDLRLRAPAPLRRYNQVVCCVPLPVRAASLDCQDYKGLQDNIKIVAIDVADRPAWYKEKDDPENKLLLWIK